jgi:rfaE bifunctional protein nucleotidyltransferase chain/domain
MIRIGLAADHNGVALKKQMSQLLRVSGNFQVVDLGPFSSEYKVDYVDYANQLSQILSNGDIDKGILICGTGVGMSMAANRFESVRAALVHNITTAPKCREHNDANVLCLGAWVATEQENFRILDSWLETDFGQGRHVKRVEKLSTSKKKIVFTNGVFDILHTGHVNLLKFAKSLGDKLIVGINSDASVRLIKGDNRPVNKEADRKSLLEALAPVDEVIVFDDREALRLLKEISPSILVKGGEWTADEVRTRDSVPDDIDIKIYPIVNGYSTTAIIKKIHEKDDWQKQDS